ncbi:hypothetical protein GCM10010964_36320 [Caldovatus sediminis]|uniref:OmpA-like domain-containing protein n=1 Tax=Caldovatus sediminis TaxID=2041189 RepID=A0A8J3EDT1_9PROT|nr:flagellar motor protein MotB [Caldovatus sediminis]GGG45689.1 hypothetical protein GCM10010964_36320 [Caldovatus sediminis]
MASKARGGRGRRGSGDGAATILVRRIEEGSHAKTAHHGGAWKVAYADFVTAMMAFFLLMWLLSSTTEEQRRAIAEFFAPQNPLGRASTGSGRPFGGLTPNDDGMMTSTAGAIVVAPGPQPIVELVEEDESETPARPSPPHDGPPGEETTDPRRTDRLAALPPEAGEEGGTHGAREGAAAWPRVAPGEAPPPVPPQEVQERAPATAAPLAAPAPPRREERPAPAAPDAVLRTQSEAALRAELARRETMELERAAERIRTAVRDDPALADLARQLLVEQTPQGLRIQLLDAERQPMFALGDSTPNERARALLARIVPVIAALPNAISIAGHTDATPFRGTGPLARSNWDLSAERANATRRVLLEAGIAGARIHSVAGHAEREPLLPEQPTAAANRRVSVTLLRMVPPDAAPPSLAATPARPDTEPRTGTAR